MKKITNKKTIIGLVVGIVSMVILIVGAAYAYFSVSTIVNFNTAAVMYSVGDQSTIILNGTSTTLYLDVTGKDMIKRDNDLIYYGSNDGKTKEKTTEQIGIATPTDPNDPGIYYCEYTLNLSHTGDNDMYNMFSGATNGIRNYQFASRGQVVLTVNGNEYDFYDPWPNQIKSSFYVSNDDPGSIDVGIRFKNSNCLNQTYLADTDITVTFTVTNLNCMSGEDEHSVYWAYSPKEIQYVSSDSSSGGGGGASPKSSDPNNKYELDFMNPKKSENEIKKIGTGGGSSAYYPILSGHFDYSDLNTARRYLDYRDLDKLYLLKVEFDVNGETQTDYYSYPAGGYTGGYNRSLAVFTNLLDCNASKEAAINLMNEYAEEENISISNIVTTCEPYTQTTFFKETTQLVAYSEEVNEWMIYDSIPVFGSSFADLSTCQQAINDFYQGRLDIYELHQPICYYSDGTYHPLVRAYDSENNNSYYIFDSLNDCNNYLETGYFSRPIFAGICIPLHEEGEQVFVKKIELCSLINNELLCFDYDRLNSDENYANQLFQHLEDLGFRIDGAMFYQTLSSPGSMLDNFTLKSGYFYDENYSYYNSSYGGPNNDFGDIDGFMYFGDSIVSCFRWKGTLVYGSTSSNNYSGGGGGGYVSFYNKNDVILASNKNQDYKIEKLYMPGNQQSGGYNYYCGPSINQYLSLGYTIENPKVEEYCAVPSSGSSAGEMPLR